MIRRLPGWEQVPIIALTADARTQMRDECLAAGMRGFLTKPIELQRLHTELVKCLDTPSSTDSASGVGVAATGRLDGTEEIVRPDPAARSGEFSGIDVQAGVTRWRTRKKFAQMLRLFLQEYEGYGERIAAAAPAEARRLAHRLKGAAAMLGIDQLSKFADAVDVQLGNAPAADEQVAALQAEMRVVRASIDRFVSGEDVAEAC